MIQDYGKYQEHFYSTEMRRIELDHDVIRTQCGKYLCRTHGSIQYYKRSPLRIVNIIVLICVLIIFSLAFFYIEMMLTGTSCQTVEKIYLAFDSMSKLCQNAYHVYLKFLYELV